MEHTSAAPCLDVVLLFPTFCSQSYVLEDCDFAPLDFVEFKMGTMAEGA